MASTGRAGLPGDDPMPQGIRPMLAVTAPEPFDSGAHQFEPKWDGLRCIAFCQEGRTWLQSRRGHDWSRLFPEVVEALQRLAAPSLILDGELVVTGVGGQPDVEAALARCQARPDAAAREAARAHPAALMAFDLLYWQGRDQRRRPLRARRHLLEAVLQGHPGSRVILSPAVIGEGRRLYAAAESLGLEGIMAKALDSPYEEGHRSRRWLKIKRFRDARAAIVGFLPSGATGIRSLALALEQPGGTLRLAGYVGSGLPGASAQASLRSRLELLRTPVPDTPPSGVALDGAEVLSGTVWVRPELWCEVRYLNAPGGPRLRHASVRELVTPS